jgi:hypothetical protein
MGIAADQANVIAGRGDRFTSLGNGGHCGKVNALIAPG